MRKNWKSALTLLFVLVTIASCGKNTIQKSAPPAEIPVIKLKSENISIYQEFVGQIYGAKDIAVRARVEGFLQEIHFNEGEFVEEGELLYVIDAQPYEAKVNTQKSKLAEAQTRKAKAKNDLDRYKPLAAENAVSQSDLDAAQADYDAAVSAVSAAKANLKSAQIELGYTRVIAPISGLIGKTQAKVGDFVGREPNPVILNTVSQTGDVKVHFFLTESQYIYMVREYSKEINEIRDNEDLEKTRKARLELILADGSTYDQKGVVDFVDRGIDATTGTLLVQAGFPNPNLLLRPGMYAKVRLAVKQIQNGIKIPQRCVKELQGQHSVYLVSDSNTIVNRQIITGATVDDYWIVTQGLEEGDRIVLEGLQKVRPGITIKPIVTEFKSQFTN